MKSWGRFWGWVWKLALSGVLALLLLLGVNSLLQLEGGAVSPWAEANQGLLSVVALSAALLVAVYENMRALRAGDQRRREFVDVVVGVMDEVAATLRAIITKAEGEPGAALNDEVILWQGKRDRAFAALEMMSPTAPDARLVLLTAEAADLIRDRPGFFGGNEASFAITPVLADMKALKAKLREVG